MSLKLCNHWAQYHMVQLYRQHLLIWNNHIFHFRPIRLWLHGCHLDFPEGSRVNTARCQTPGPAEMKYLKGWTQNCNYWKPLTSPVGGRFYIMNVKPLGIKRSTLGKWKWWGFQSENRSSCQKPSLEASTEIIREREVQKELCNSAGGKSEMDLLA